MVPLTWYETRSIYTWYTGQVYVTLLSNSDSRTGTSITLLKVRYYHIVHVLCIVHACAPVRPGKTQPGVVAVLPLG